MNLWYLQYTETPLTAPEGIWFTDNRIMLKEPDTFNMHWLAGNLTQTDNAQVNIYLYGYRERSILPEIIFIDTIAVSL